MHITKQPIQTLKKLYKEKWFELVKIYAKKIERKVRKIKMVER